LSSASQRRCTISRLRGSRSSSAALNRDIVQQRWLADDKPTLHQLAAEYQISAERIRQLETNAMKKLRAALPASA